VWTPEKLEGVGVAADGQPYPVTDNDGVDGATGETVFARLTTAARRDLRSGLLFPPAADQPTRAPVTPRPKRCVSGTARTSA
jgi:hypothetical protein